MIEVAIGFIILLVWSMFIKLIRKPSEPLEWFYEVVACSLVVVTVTGLSGLIGSLVRLVFKV